MPQMSPIMWLNLFFLFSMTLILFNQNMYFSFKSNKINLNKINYKTPKTNWKW
uniref:ATP synthase complex subunit 8 n=1 Tax=Monistria discrepans TaxID=1634151 RepID=A0A516IMT6_9ORTH|nr:ATP synthase F0 subunit 8 [Monistria discrepans]